MGSIEDYFTGARILVTGATGLVGRVLVEKILRDLPQVERLYVLIRPRHRGERTLSAQERLRQEVFTSTAFDRLRQHLGHDFASFVETKVEAVSGDLSLDRLGMDEETYRRLQQEVDLIINCAAVVSFDAPLDAALQLNTLGPLRIMEFAKGCRDATVAHVSTCYVNGTRHGAIAEEPLDPVRLASARNGSRPPSLDIDEEVEAVLRLTQRIHRQSSSLLHRGAFALRAWTHRADRRVAWENGLGPETDRLQRSWVEHRLVVEGTRWAHRRGFYDVYTLTKAMGEQLVLRHRGDVPTLILRPSIVESALESPVPGWLDGMRMLDPLIVAYSRNQMPDFPGWADAIMDIMPVDMVVNALLSVIPKADLHDGPAVYHVASGMQKPLTMRSFADLVREYYQREARSGAAAQPRSFPRITFPTTRRFLWRLRYRYALPLMLLSGLVLVRSILPRGRRLRNLYRSRRAGLERLAHYARIYGPYAETECHYLSHRTNQVWESLTDEERHKFNFDVTRIDWRYYIQDVHIPGLKRFVLGAAGDGRSPGTGSPHQQVPWPRRTIPLPDERELDRWIQQGELWSPARAALRWGFDQFFHYYTGLHCEGLEYVPKTGPYIVAANHCSHFDTGVLMVLLARGGKVHPLAAKDYFFRNWLWGWLSRRLVDAAPFDRHSLTPDSLALALGLLARNHSLLYFPEGGRSLDGEMRPFKRGIGLLALEAAVPVVPAYTRGSFQVLRKGRTVPKRHPIHVRFGPPISPEQYLSANGEEGTLELSRTISEDIQKAVQALS